MNHLDICSGIGGFSLAARWVWGEDHNILSFCEKDEFCQKVLKKHWPGVPITGDIRDMKGNIYGAVDLLTAGLPCQPFSIAGQRRGKADDRYLWGDFFRILQESQPSWVICENVPGIHPDGQISTSKNPIIRKRHSPPGCGGTDEHHKTGWNIAGNL